MGGGAVVFSTGTGTVTLEGRGGTGGAGGQLNCGVDIEGASALVRSVNGNINMTGQGGGVASGHHNIGIRLFSSGQVTSTGLATITLDGTGGPGVQAAWGVSLEGTGTQVTSVNADIQITGQGGGAGASRDDYGVLEDSGCTIAAGGAGKVTVQGTGGAGSGVDEIGVLRGPVDHLRRWRRAGHRPGWWNWRLV